jgi:hypothetical protein
MVEEGAYANAASFGIGAAVNCFFPLNNAKDNDGQYDNVGLHRSKDPGAGAFTPYHGRTGEATQDIQAGQEIFVNYGTRYFTSRMKTYGPIPLPQDYADADQLLRDSYVQMQDTTFNVTDRVNLESSVLRFLRDLARIWDSRALFALPETIDDLDYVIRNGTGNLFLNRSIVSIDTLKHSGTCIDNIRPGNSTLWQAGRGAFATRRILAGDAIAPLPLIHVKDRRMLQVYFEKYEEDDTLVPDTSRIQHQQLLLNYCFGHRHSTLLLCPYGFLTALVNHGPSDRDRNVMNSPVANAKLQWSAKATLHPEWLEQPLDQWGDNEHAGLAFEIVALHDIQAGEEILMDYGSEWEAAWEQHVTMWKPSTGSEDYSSAAQVNENVDLILRTASEEPYPFQRYLELYCHQEYRLLSGLPEQFDNQNGNHDDAETHRCRVIDRFIHSKTGEYQYTAELLARYKNLDERTCEEDVVEIVWAIPRDAFIFQDPHYSRDHAQPWSFRHPIMIPDHVMPPAWKNVS